MRAAQRGRERDEVLRRQGGHAGPVRVAQAYLLEPARPEVTVERALPAPRRVGQLGQRPAIGIAPPLGARVVLADAGGLLHDAPDQCGRGVRRLVDVPHHRCGHIVLPVGGPPGRVVVQPLLELVARLRGEVAGRAEREHGSVGDGLGGHQAPHGAGVLHSTLGLGHLLGQLALGADGEVLDLAQRVELAHGDHGHVRAAHVVVDVGAEGADLHEGEVEAHLAQPDHAGHDER